jgi:2-C-methyl-D-erythritol 4-phosphate cytidylyltransferase
VVVSAADGYIDEVLPAGLAGVTVLRCGGATRMDSVLNGLRAIQGEIADSDMVLVHDAARPGLTPALIARLIDGVGDDPAGGLLALPVVDTVKRSAPSAQGVAPPRPCRVTACGWRRRRRCSATVAAARTGPRHRSGCDHR